MNVLSLDFHTTNSSRLGLTRSLHHRRVAPRPGVDFLMAHAPSHHLHGSSRIPAAMHHYLPIYN